MTQRYVLFLIFVGALFALIGAWVAENLFAIQPCALCFYQRYIYWGILVLAGTASLLDFRKLNRFALGVLCLLLLGEMGVALYQVGIELKWIPLPEVCKALPLSGEKIEELRQQLMAQPHVSCDKVQWRLFGVSMAGYNVLYSLALLIIAIFGLAFPRKRTT